MIDFYIHFFIGLFIFSINDLIFLLKIGIKSTKLKHHHSIHNA